MISSLKRTKCMFSTNVVISVCFISNILFVFSVIVWVQFCCVLWELCTREVIPSQIPGFIRNAVCLCSKIECNYFLCFFTHFKVIPKALNIMYFYFNLHYLKIFILCFHCVYILYSINALIKHYISHHVSLTTNSQRLYGVYRGEYLDGCFTPFTHVTV